LFALPPERGASGCVLEAAMLMLAPAATRRQEGEYDVPAIEIIVPEV
jgi:hypothetical protein